MANIRLYRCNVSCVGIVANAGGNSLRNDLLDHIGSDLGVACSLCFAKQWIEMDARFGEYGAFARRV